MGHWIKNIIHAASYNTFAENNKINLMFIEISWSLRLRL